MTADLICWGLDMAATQGLLAAMVADTTCVSLRGTAFGLFNLASGVTMLIASLVAGILWDRLGASATFYARAGLRALPFCCCRMTYCMGMEASNDINMSGNFPCA